MKRILIFAYYFPPAGGPGVQRPLRFVRHLPDFGWQPTVISVRESHAAWPSIDRPAIDEIPEGVQVIRTRSFDPYTLYARLTGKTRSEAVGVGFPETATRGVREWIARWIRANLFLPDARVGWNRHARRAAIDLIEKDHFDAILTTGPPHSTHLAGRAMARRFHIPWVADFRDLWPDPNYAHQLPTNRLGRFIDGRLRDRVLQRADAVVAVTGSMAAQLKRLTGAPVSLVANGFEPGDFENVDVPSHVGFEVLHAGSLSPEKNPDSLWKALFLLKRDGAVPELRVRLLGSVDESVRNWIEAAELSDRVIIEPSVSHAEAVGRMVGADALLLVINRVDQAAGIVTGKVYEYAAAGRPVIGIGPVAGEAAKVVAASGAGSMFEHDDVAGLRDHLQQLYDRWERGNPAAGAAPDQASVFSRRVRTKELAAVLNAVSEPVAR